MYLSMLSKQEQMDFLELAFYSMGVDGTHKAEEQEVFESYKYECQSVNYQIFKQEDIQIVINELKHSSQRVKKIILLELFGILLADNEACESEQKFIKELANEFNIQEAELANIHKWVLAMNKIVQYGYELIK